MFHLRIKVKNFLIMESLNDYLVIENKESSNKLYENIKNPLDYLILLYDSLVDKVIALLDYYYLKNSLNNLNYYRNNKTDPKSILILFIKRFPDYGYFTVSSYKILDYNEKYEL